VQYFWAFFLYVNDFYIQNLHIPHYELNTDVHLQGDFWCIGWQNSGTQSRDNKNMTLLGGIPLQDHFLYHYLLFAVNFLNTASSLEWDCHSHYKREERANFWQHLEMKHIWTWLNLISEIRQIHYKCILWNILSYELGLYYLIILSYEPLNGPTSFFQRWNPTTTWKWNLKFKLNKCVFWARLVNCHSNRVLVTLSRVCWGFTLGPRHLARSLSTKCWILCAMPT